MSGLVLGIDTSCYTTSLAVLAEDGALLAEQRSLLRVRPGGRGLSQSEMVFQHTRNLPVLFKKAFTEINRSSRCLRAIAVSAGPRPLPDSYMPAFLVGDGYAGAVGAVCGIEPLRISHQEGHLYAGLWSAGGPADREFLALHVSGGTTEVLLVSRAQTGLSIEWLGGTIDLQAGQFIDRVGVALGQPFPAGRHLEKLAQAGHASPLSIPVAVSGLNISFSGPASCSQRLIDKGADPAALAAGVEECIAHSLLRVIIAAHNQTGLTQVLLVGGVTANGYIRNYLRQKLPPDMVVYFPSTAFSSDNAVGVAYAALGR